MNLEKLLAKYDYGFPKELIATEPAHPRDSAKLLIYNKESKQTSFDTFKNLGAYLPEKCVLVFNETKVLPARLPLKKETGGEVQLLYIRHTAQEVVAKSNKFLRTGMKLSLNNHPLLIAKEKTTEGWVFSLAPKITISRFLTQLKKHGITPLPPYIKNPALTEKQIKKEYQTVFAKNEGSVAAPTASLHFTKKLISDLQKQGVETCFVTLHVGLGTFGTLTEEHIKTKTLHSEEFFVDKKTAARLIELKTKGYKIIPVGTTALRTLETVFSTSPHTLYPSPLSGSTSLFIQEGYQFKFVDGLITNFHVPKSSLMMLVAALTGRKTLLKLYMQAIDKQFKLFSFGDGMLLL